ncbi:MAG TPA: DUF2783 domain-containing protein [Beijerinckiaceae bacterium]|jgi:predicted protein tyrosine phosphatase
MPPLLTESRLSDPDRAYRMLIDAHRGLSDEASAALNTRLVLILANHVGDDEALAQAIALAKQAGPPPGEADRLPSAHRSDTLA